MEAVSARGREMAKVSVEDNGAMAAVFGPLDEIQRTVDAASGYAVVANINSYNQAVVGGATKAVEKIIETFAAKGINAVRIPVSHAFHTSIVAPASVPFVNALRRLNLVGPKLPIVANVTGEFYPADATTETMLDYTGKQIASPVQFVKGLQTLYAAGARVFVEVGPKKALHGFARTSWAASTTTCSPCSPTTRRSTTPPRSTRPCAACMPRGWVFARPLRPLPLRRPPPRLRPLWQPPSPRWPQLPLRVAHRPTRSSPSSASCSLASWSRA